MTIDRLYDTTKGPFRVIRAEELDRSVSKSCPSSSEFDRNGNGALCSLNFSG